MSVLVYDQITVTDPGSLETSGSVRVRDIVSAILGTPGSTLAFDGIGISDSGYTSFFGPLRVRDSVQVNLTGGFSPNLSRAIVDVINLIEFTHRVLNPAYTSVSDTTYVRDDPGQDQPIAVREYINLLLSGAQAITAIPDPIYTRESVNTNLRTALISASVSDSIFIRDEVIRSSSKFDSIAVTESVIRNLYGGLITASLADSVSVSPVIYTLLEPLYTDQAGNDSVVSDFVVGFLSAHQPQTKIVIDQTTVTDFVIRKHSAISVLVYDTIGTSDKKRNTRRIAGWLFEYTWRW